MSKKKRRKPRTMSETIRQVILDSGETLYRVSKDSGVTYAPLHRFVQGARGLSMENLDALCEYLGLSLIRDNRR